MLQSLTNLSTASSLALGWLGILLCMFIFNWRVGWRLLPIFALGFFVYLVYITIKSWPKQQKNEKNETQTTEKTNE